jgi:hypothetical protein
MGIAVRDRVRIVILVTRFSSSAKAKECGRSTVRPSRAVAGDIFVIKDGEIHSFKAVGDSSLVQLDVHLNISAILEADGASLRDVIKVTVHLSDTSLFTRYNTVYAQRFSKPYPVRTTVGSDRCHSPGMLIEIDYIALNRFVPNGLAN